MKTYTIDEPLWLEQRETGLVTLNKPDDVSGAYVCLSVAQQLKEENERLKELLMDAQKMVEYCMNKYNYSPHPSRIIRIDRVLNNKTA